LTSMKYIKLFGLIVGIIALNIIVLSPGLLGISIGANTFSTAFGITLLIASAFALLYGSYTIFYNVPAVVPVKNLKTHEEFVEALNEQRSIKVIEDDMNFAIEQMGRLKKKIETLMSVLKQRFEPSELSYKKFVSTISEVEKLYYLNIRSILNRLNVFDEAEFNRVMSTTTPRFTKELLDQKRSLYQEFLDFMKFSLGTNEEILLKLDKLLLEISRLDSVTPEEIEKMSCMQEIDTLIKQTKYYKE